MNMILEITLRLFVALILGGIIGIEREYRSKEAGFRTHFLVALGSALFCIVSQYGFGFDLKDSSRVAAQVVSGIGFLGAGTIIFQKNVVRGLTTAAGLWVTAAIGLTCGTGMYIAAGIATAMVLFGLEVMNSFIPIFGTTTVHKSRKTKRDGCEKRNAFIETKTKCASNLIRKVTAYLQNQSKTPSLYIKINGIQMDF